MTQQRPLSSSSIKSASAMSWRPEPGISEEAERASREQSQAQKGGGEVWKRVKREWPEVGRTWRAGKQGSLEEGKAEMVEVIS